MCSGLYDPALSSLSLWLRGSLSTDPVEYCGAGSSEGRDEGKRRALGT